MSIPLEAGIILAHHIKTAMLEKEANRLRWIEQAMERMNLTRPQAERYVTTVVGKIHQVNQNPILRKSLPKAMAVRAQTGHHMIFNKNPSGDFQYSTVLKPSMDLKPGTQLIGSRKLGW